MGSIKDRHGMDLTEAEDIKKRWQKYTELYKKDLHDPDNHDGMTIHLEPDILEHSSPNRPGGEQHLRHPPEAAALANPGWVSRFRITGPFWPGTRGI